MTVNNSAIESHLAIKAVCVIGFINATQMLNLIFSPVTKHISLIFPAYFAVAVLISLVCLAGLWLMKKWAAVTYAIILICNQIALIMMGFWEITALVIPAVIMAVLFKQRKNMT